MGKILFISEKPKVANTLVKNHRFNHSTKHLGSQPYFGYYENEKYIHSWARGHLLELFNPGDHDDSLNDFQFENLPLILPVKYKAVEETKEQLELLVQLLNRPDVDRIVNACDIDKEGELIFREIYLYAKCNKPVLRLSLSSYEGDEVEAALNRLEDGSNFDLLFDSARGRQYLDHLVGDTITRSSTVKLANKNFLLSGGRVQLCLLNEIRQRELAVERFKPQTYFNLFADTGFLSMLHSEDPILDPKLLEAIKSNLVGQYLTVEDYKERQSSKNPSNLYNLTDLYKDCIHKLSFSAPKAKKIIQSLYEDGLITYPRTDSRHLPESMLDTVIEMVQLFKESAKFKPIANYITSEITTKHRSFNDEYVTAHFAIIPTKKQPGECTQDELKVYELIVHRFLAAFMDPAKFLVREVSMMDRNEHIFMAREKVLLEKGFMAVFQDEKNEVETEKDSVIHSFTIPDLRKGEQLMINDCTIKSGQTKRPSYHTESSILTFMENAGRQQIEDEALRELMKGKRIGTPATAESFIPKLLERGYIALDGTKLMTTSLGAAFIDTIPVDKIKDPSYTAEMESDIQKIQNAELKYEDFYAKVNHFAYYIVDKMAAVNSQATKLIEDSRNKDIVVCSCSCHSGKIIDKGKFYGCTNYPDCSILLPKQLKEKAIPVKQLEKLLKDGTTDLLKGFKGENNSTFDAYLILKEGKLKFRFPTIDELSLGICPKCKKGKISKIKVTEKDFFGCSEHRQGCDFTFPTIILEKKIPEGQIKKLLEYGHTDFITGFISKDSGNEFTAALVLKEDGSIKLKMPTIDDKTLGSCPHCKGRVILGKSYYLCENYKKTCDFLIPPVFMGKQISAGQIQKLLEKNITDIIKGFEKKDKSGTFDAKLSYSKEEKRLVFVFDKNKSQNKSKGPRFNGKSKS